MRTALSAFPMARLRNTRGEPSGSARGLHQLLNERAGHVGRQPRVTMKQRAVAQHRLGTVQGRNVGALKESPDGDLITPEQRFFHRGHPVGGVVSMVVLELFHARTEPLVIIIVIIFETGAENIQEREPLVLNALLVRLCEVLLLGSE